MCQIWSTSSTNYKMSSVNDPVTMAALATGHQVRCILWEQVPIFNKGIGFSMWIKIPCIEYILWRILTTKFMFDARKKMLNFTVKNLLPINSYEFLNIQACSFRVFWNKGCTQSLVVSWKLWAVPLICTRVSGYSQVILLASILFRSQRVMYSQGWF